MKKNNIVRKKFEFDNIIKTGDILKNNSFIIYYKSNELECYRFGISVGKKLGNAVFRNKYKRKIRSIIDQNKKYYQNNLDYIIIMRKGCVKLSFISMKDEFLQLILNINKRRLK